MADKKPYVVQVDYRTRLGIKKTEIVGVESTSSGQATASAAATVRRKHPKARDVHMTTWEN